MKLAPHGGGNIGAHAVASLPQGLNVETYPGLRAAGAKVMKFFEIDSLCTFIKTWLSTKAILEDLLSNTTTLCIYSLNIHYNCVEI